MEIKANSLSLRGDSGLVKIVSDSVFDPASNSSMYTDEAECDLIIESNGFRVNKAIILSMPSIRAFLGDLKLVADRGSGRAELQNSGSPLKIVFSFDRGQPTVTCSMDDKPEGKENSVAVKYGIEPTYFEELKRELAEALEPARKGR